MSIVVRCSCGRAFQAPPALAGKRVKCPVCGNQLVVNPTIAPEPQTFAVSCSCGGRFKAKAALAGKTVRCPKCSASLQVPMAEQPTSGPPTGSPNRGTDAALTSNPFPSSSPEADPLAGSEMGTALERFLASSPVRPMPAPADQFAGTPRPQATRSAKSSNTRRIWIVLAIVGGGFGFLCLGCGGLFVIRLREAIQQAIGPSPDELVSALGSSASKTLVEARKGFVTKIVSTEESFGPPDDPTGSDFELIRYQSPVGPLAAYLTRDPQDGQKHPAIVWITGGDCNSIGDVWSPSDPSDDQSASPFRKAGIVMMFPSLRGGNDNPGRREGFYGEVDDVLAATDHLASVPYVDADQIYLGGHSTGGTLVMLVGECSDRYRAVFSLGPVAIASQYGGLYIYCDPNDRQEIALRSPLIWLHSVKSPMYVFEGSEDGNWDAIEMMADANKNPQIHFFKIPRHDHFSVIAPLSERLAAQINSRNVNVTKQSLQGL